MNRRTFFLKSSLTAISAAVSAPLFARSSAHPLSVERAFTTSATYKKNVNTRGSIRDDDFILPPSLQGGMRVGITAPASGVSRSELDSGIEFLKSLDLNVVLGKCLYKNNGFLSAPDEQRATEFMDFIQRPDIDAILCARGGYGVMRMLPMLNYETIRNNPKIIMGYSDITALLIAIHNRSRVITYHGPVCSSEFDTITSSSFIKTVISNKADLYTSSAPADTPAYRDSSYDVIYTGKAQGRLTGGNLTMVCSTLGTPFEIDTKGCILFLEDVSEEPYKIDRMLTQLWLAGKLNQVAGIVLGVFKHCDPYRNTERQRDDMTSALRDVFESRFASLRVPVMAGLPIGHIRSKLTLPLGVMASMNTEDMSFSLIEPSVG